MLRTELIKSVGQSPGSNLGQSSRCIPGDVNILADWAMTFCFYYFSQIIRVFYVIIIFLKLDICIVINIIIVTQAYEFTTFV